MTGSAARTAPPTADEVSNDIQYPRSLDLCDSALTIYEPQVLDCGRLERFVRVRCETCHAKHLVGFSCKNRDCCASCAARGAWPKAPQLGQIQCFGK